MLGELTSHVQHSLFAYDNKTCECGGGVMSEIWNLIGQLLPRDNWWVVAMSVATYEGVGIY